MLILNTMVIQEVPIQNSQVATPEFLNNKNNYTKGYVRRKIIKIGENKSPIAITKKCYKSILFVFPLYFIFRYRYNDRLRKF